MSIVSRRAGAAMAAERSEALTGHRLFAHEAPFRLRLGGLLTRFELAFETWGELSPARDNAILLQTGLSPSSHARSHAGASEPGWWEEFIGSGLALDTDRFFVNCSNVLGGCFGSTGPSSIDPRTGRPFALSFPSLTIDDMAATQHALVRHLGIQRLHAVIGSSMGGMQALSYAAQFPHEVASLVSISAAGRSHPWSIAIRFIQRQAVLADPDWNGGEYYDRTPPLHGLHIARQLGTISYRGQSEWGPRFGRERVEAHPGEHPDLGLESRTGAETFERTHPPRAPVFPARTGVEAARAHRFGVDFQVESYLAHQADKFVRIFDANSYLYISKAMDIFDLGEGQPSYEAGIARIQARSLIVGVPSDLLFPIFLQEDLDTNLRRCGRDSRFRVLDSIYGHDSFLVEVAHLAPILREFLAGQAP